MMLGDFDVNFRNISHCHLGLNSISSLIFVKPGRRNGALGFNLSGGHRPARAHLYTQVSVRVG